MLREVVLNTFLFIALTSSFNYQYSFSRSKFSPWVKKAFNQQQENFHTGSIFKHKTLMSMTEQVPDTTETPKVQVDDFSQYKVGQQYEGKVISAKNFGCFVDISKGSNVLVPRSQLSNGNFEKLKKMADDKSQDLIKIELIDISAENQTLAAKFIPAVGQGRADLSSLEGVDFGDRLLKASVVSVHDFGVFAQLEEYGVEGLIPTSRLPEKLQLSELKEKYPAGTGLEVRVEEVNIDRKKLILSMKNNRADVSAFTDLPQDKWMQATVQSTSSFGLFVRPAGSNNVGLVHVSRIPRDLVKILKSRMSEEDLKGDKSDVEKLFQEGDVIKVRVQAVKVGSRRLEMSMLPYRASDDNDDYIVEGRDPEGEEFRSFEDNDDEVDKFDPENVILWWRGAPYVKTPYGAVLDQDEETAVLNESADIVDGTWRRMFELDMRAEAADFSSKVLDKELKELADEIGELSGLDEEMIDAAGYGMTMDSKPDFGAFVALDSLPEEWKKEMEFFKQLSVTEGAISQKLRGGQKEEKAEFDSLLREVELELDQAAPKQPKTVDPVIAAVTEAETAEGAPEASSESPVAAATENAAPAAEEAKEA